MSGAHRYNTLQTPETKSYFNATDAGVAVPTSSTWVSSKLVVNHISSAMNVSHGK